MKRGTSKTAGFSRRKCSAPVFMKAGILLADDVRTNHWVLQQEMSDSSIPTPRVAAFMRQYTHDVRNTINCMDLEMELMQDLVTDPEAVTSMNRIREQLRSMELQMRSLSAAFHEPRPTPDRINARVLMQIWREKQAELAESVKTLWNDRLDGEEVEVDVEMMAQVFNELLANAAAHSSDGPVTVSAEAKDGKVCFELRETKKEPVEPGPWAMPFSAASRGRYGLGLWGARRKLEANHADFRQFYDEKAGCLVTEIKLPTHR